MQKYFRLHEEMIESDYSVQTSVNYGLCLAYLKIGLSIQINAGVAAVGIIARELWNDTTGL